MATDRIVTEWILDPTKAEKGAQRASDAVKKASDEMVSSADKGDKAVSRVIRGVRKRGDNTKITLDKTRGSLRGLERGLGAAAFGAGNFEQSMSGAGRELLLTTTSLGLTAGAIAALSLGVGLLIQLWKKSGEAARKAQELQLENRRKLRESLDQEIEGLREANKLLALRFGLMGTLGRAATNTEIVLADARERLALAEEKIQRARERVPRGGARGIFEEEPLTPGPARDAFRRDVAKDPAVKAARGEAARLRLAVKAAEAADKEAKALAALAKDQEKATAATEARVAANEATLKSIESTTVAIGSQVDLMKLIEAGEDRRTAAVTLQENALKRRVAILKLVEESHGSLTEFQENELLLTQQQLKVLAEQKALILSTASAAPKGAEDGLGKQIETTVAGGAARGLVAGIREGGDAAAQILESTLTAVLQNISSNVIGGKGGLFAQIFRLGATDAAG